MSRRPRRSITRGAPVLAAAVLVLGALTWPLLFTYSGFAGDWEHHLWLVWHQSLSIQSGHFPSLFLNSSYSVFYPLYAFYGGTLFAVAGTLSLALGHAPVQAYVLICIVDFAAALGGWYWLGRMAGVGRWPAMAPGLVFVTSAYYITLVYVRGDWPEFTGVSMIPLMVASGVSVLRAERLRPGAAFALAASSVLFFGSHNITILLGLTTLALTGLALVVCVPDARGLLSRRGAIRLSGVVVPAALVSAWYLLPALAYDSRTRIASEYRHAQGTIRVTAGLVSLGHLLSFSRGSALPTASPYPFALSLPVLAIAWVLVGVLILPRGSRNRTWTRLLMVCCGMALLTAVVMTHVGLLLALPRPYTATQFSYRLETYVLLELCAAMLAALVLARGGSRRVRPWTWIAIPVCIVSLLGAIQQIRAYPYPGQDRYEALESYGEIAALNDEDYQDVSAPVIAARGLSTVDIPFESVHDDRVSFSTHLRPGTLVATNIGAGSYLVHVTGAKAVGVDSQTGDMVLQVGSGAGADDGRGGGAGERRSGEAAASTGSTPEETITVSTGGSLPIVLGRVLTLVGLSILALELLVLPVCRLLSRRVPSPVSHDRDAQTEALDRGVL
jgi:hypothetical protein